MARARLDLTNPVFIRSTQKHQNNRDFHDGLEAARVKIEAEHTSCGRVVQPMGKNFPQCHGKIWKYDWAPVHTTGFTRKSWRLVAIVPDATTVPIEIIAAAVYEKQTLDQLTLKELAKIFSSVTSSVAVGPEAPEEKFRRVSNGEDGQTRSLCNKCFLAVAISADDAELSEGEQRHHCPAEVES